MAVYLLKLVKPLAVGALVGLICAHWLSDLTSATFGVAAFWIITMRFL